MRLVTLEPIGMRLATVYPIGTSWTYTQHWSYIVGKVTPTILLAQLKTLERLQNIDRISYRLSKSLGFVGFEPKLSEINVSRY